MDIIFDHVVVRYDTGKMALGPVNLVVHGGECVFVTGPNGGGKTTLARLLSGILIPVSGELRMGDGIVRSEWPPDYVGWIQQEPEHQVVGANILGDVNLSSLWHASSYRQSVARTRQALKDTGLEPLGARAAETLSGGELHLAAIAAIMAQHAQVLVVDEPETMLDASGQLRVEKMLQALNEQGKTLFVISHNRIWGRLADRHLWVQDGKVEEMDQNGAAQRLADDWMTFCDGLQAITDRPFESCEVSQIGKLIWPF